MDCSLPRSSVHGISQARILEWVAVSFSRGIFLDQGSDLGLLNWREDSLPLNLLGKPCSEVVFLIDILSDRAAGNL